MELRVLVSLILSQTPERPAMTIDMLGRSAVRLLITGAVSTIFVVLPSGLLSAQEGSSPACWIRPDQADLEIRASPFDSTSIGVAGGEIKICYSRPRMLGRPIMGRLVPHGEPWRFGADEATAVHVSFPASIAGVAVEPGRYTLYVVPDASEWTVVVNAATQRWGVPIDAAVRARDVGSGTVPVERTDAPVELLTLTLEPVSASEVALVAEWERTRVRIPIRAR